VGLLGREPVVAYGLNQVLATPTPRTQSTGRRPKGSARWRGRLGRRQAVALVLGKAYAHGADVVQGRHRPCASSSGPQSTAKPLRSAPSAPAVRTAMAWRGAGRRPKSSGS
jgi:hypothetical protein